MNNKYIYISLIGLFLSFTVIGQEKQVERADKYFEKLAYIDARETYIKVIENGYDSVEIYQKIADSYYFNADLKTAAKWYEKLFTKYAANNMEPEYLFRYSQSLKSIEEYERADEIMMDFNNFSNLQEKRTKLFKKDRNYLDLIAMQSGRFKVKNLKNINSVGSDFGPSFYKDEVMVFASSRESGISKVVHEWDEAVFLDLFYTTRAGANSLSVEGVEKFNRKINTKLHESSPVFTKDGNTMYFTRNNYTKKRMQTDSDGTILLKLYKAEKLSNGQWGNVMELPFNSNNYSVAHPALSTDEKYLYFASNMPGTKGLSDLFVSEIQGDNTYGTPKNLGGVINTEGRETFPFISKSGKLFFASDGHIGLGGLDVFVAEPSKISSSKASFNEPFNVGKPVNTPNDDFSFIIDESTKIGYFSSNRKGGKGKDDIYSLKQTKELISRCNQHLSGVITDADTREILPGAVITLFNSNMNKVATTTADEKAMYSLPIECSNEYIIRAQKDTYEPTEVNLVTNNQFEQKYKKPLQLSKGAPILNNIATNVGDDLAKILQLKPIYFDLDKSFIRPDAEVELQKVIAAMKQYPKIEIDVRSHTDSRNTSDYNINLSNRRAKSTIAYILEKGGISGSRLTGRGYGEIELQNNCADGVKCSEEEHQQNRRSEFIIMKQ